jgi:hypothetical protein
VKGSGLLQSAAGGGFAAEIVDQDLPLVIAGNMPAGRGKKAAVIDGLPVVQPAKKGDIGRVITGIAAGPGV